MSLFSRVIGLDGEKLGIHLVHAMVSEMINGRQTLESSIEVLKLNESEALDLKRMVLTLSSSSDKFKTSARVFNYLVLGELKIKGHRDYTNESLFWQMVEAE